MERASVVALKTLIDTLKKREVEFKPPIPIGLSAVDECLWGLHRGELLLVAGRPSSGKTSLALHIALQVASANKGVLFFSLEETIQMFLRRLLCTVGMIDNTRMRHYNFAMEDPQKMDAALHLFEGWKFGIYDSVRKLPDIVKSINEYSKSITPIVVVLDYIQLMNWQGFENKRLAIEHFIIELRRLAQEYHFALVICSQLNRAPETRRNKRPILSDLKESGSLEEHSDTVIALYYPIREESKEEDRTKMEIHVLKQRHGATGTFQVEFQPQFYRFKDIAKP